MKVKKILNNSLILVENDLKQDLILMGKGLRFKTKVGDDISPSCAEKIFISDGDSLTNNIMQMAEDIDSVYFEIVKKIIDYGSRLLGTELPDYLYLSLVNHIYFAVSRFEKNIQLELVDVSDLELQYSEEVQIGRFALKTIQDELNVSLFPNEASNIALHFINAQESKFLPQDIKKINKATDDILKIIKYHFELVYDMEDISYARAVTHIQLLVKRLVDKKLLPNENNSFLHKHIIESCPSEAECVKKINQYIENKFKESLTNQEEMYLVLHIHRLYNGQIR